MTLGNALTFIATLLVATIPWQSSKAQEPLRLQVISATVRGQMLPGATVILQRNGEQSLVATSDAGGTATIQSSFRDDLATLLIVRKPGYSDLVAKCPCSGLTYALSPVMTNLDGMRIVLSWGPQPPDLDGHLVFARNHIFFNNKRGDDVIQDVDNTTGYGPETITVTRKHDGERYAYAVVDYTDKHDGATDKLSRSGATVFVYVGQTLVRTYYVPKAKIGNVWQVFSISEEGEFQDINKVIDVPYDSAALLGGETLGLLGQPGSQVAAEPSGVAPSAPGEAPPVFAPSATADPRAKHFNTLGEASYHAGNYEEAMRQFQNAIDLDANYGQAYSNLALLFRKTGRSAEALWADRKAIALARGAAAATTRASAHYNDGRIYEAAQQWGDALREYRAARAEKSNSVYDNAIQRMESQVNP